MTLGKFDGLHRGHQKLVDKIEEYGKNDGCESVLCAFDMGRDSLMTTKERRVHLDGRIHWLEEYPLPRELREMVAQVFLRQRL